VNYEFRIVFVAAIAASLAFSACSSEDFDNELWTASYDTVWQTVNENHYDSTFGGLDWSEIHGRYQDRMKAVDSDEGFIKTVNEMLRELKLSHYSVFQMKEKAKTGSPMFSSGSVGVDIRLLDNQVVISKVVPDSPADRAGLKPGYIVESIDGVAADDIIGEAEAEQLDHFNERKKLGNVADDVLGRFFGDAGTQVAITYLDEADMIHEATLERHQRTGETIISDLMPPFYMEFEAKRIGNDIGYVNFNAFAPPVDSLFDEAIDAMMDVRGLIIDIRGNPGGMHEIGESIVSRLLQEKTLFSVFRSREGTEEVVVEPRGATYAGPVVVMIDVMNGSASERFSGCIQSIGRAVVIGERSPGSVGPSDLKELPNGASFMYLVAQSLTPDGTVLEGHGVIPDITVKLDRNALLTGTDTQLARAVGFIRDEGRK